jgi:lipoprotein-anchoring transpeptidase ErfK/SrfK
VNLPLARRLASLLAASALALCGTSRAIAADFQAEIPLPEGARSVEVSRPDEPLYQAPSTSAARRGAASKGARLPVFAMTRGPGCEGYFISVGPLAWLCDAGGSLSAAPPDASEPTVPPDGLPYRYYFVGPNGALGYRALETAEDGVPDTELLKGFGVALVRVAHKSGGDEFGLTSAGVWVPTRDLNPVTAPALRGQELDGASLAIVWVVSDSPAAFVEPDKARDRSLKLSKFQQLPLLEEREVKGHHWYRVAEKSWLSDRDARTPERSEPPAELRPGERWLDVDTNRQVLTSYVGDKPVFATLVSTGRGVDGTELATPKGVHRLWVKLRTSDMDNLDDQSAAENYAIQAVPWVMYFERGYGLHGTFWHHAFGTKHSHGCVNLSPRDAARLFAWTSPRLPMGWSAVFPTVYEPGTLVRVR